MALKGYIDHEGRYGRQSQRSGGISSLRPKLLFRMVSLFLLAACAVFNIRAQDAPPGGPGQRPTPTPPPIPHNRVRARGIYGTIRWKKEYGLPSTDGGTTPNKALNCTAFRVDATVQEGTPGTFGKASSIGYWTVQNEPTEENGYYICRYSITDRNPLPRNRVITVSAFLGPFAGAELNQTLVTGGWFGPGQPRPPAASQRVVIGGRGITLTDSEPRASVDFEMVYRPLPTVPR